MVMSEKLKQYANDHQEQFKALLLDLCRIPAPLNGERARAEFCKHWLEERGAEGIIVDDVNNMIFPYQCDGEKKVVVIEAHTDTVFQDTEPFEPVIHDDRILCPGVGDDTVHVAILLMMAQFLLQEAHAPLSLGLVLVANSGEEGLGNLKGTRAVIDRWGSRTKEFISLDGQCHEIFTTSVGSFRARYKVHTAGGHSYGDFGKANAIQQAGHLIQELYQMKVPENKIPGIPKTTYNVGLIGGGSAVNAIAQDAWFDFEYRAGTTENAQKMKTQVEQIIKEHQDRGWNISMEVLGERPFGNNADPVCQSILIGKVKRILQNETRSEIHMINGSTDCNYPLSMGIPSVAFGCYEGGGAHTREEYLNMSCLPGALRIGMALLNEYME